MTALYVLAADYQASAAKLADLDLDEQTIADTLESLSGALEVKASNVAMLARNLEATAESIKAAEGEMAKRRKAVEARAAGLRRYLLSAMQTAGIKKVESPYMVLGRRANPPAVEVFDAAQVPAQFMLQPEPPPAAPDKAAIKEALAAGQDVPGCRLVTGERIDIR